MKLSPWVLTTRPPKASISLWTRALCWRRIRKAASSPYCSVYSVKPRMSLKRMVTVAPKGIDTPDVGWGPPDIFLSLAYASRRCHGDPSRIASEPPSPRVPALAWPYRPWAGGGARSDQPLRLGPDRGLHPVGGEGHRPEPYPDGVEHRIGDSRRHHRRRRLPGPPGGLPRPVQQLDVDLRSLRTPQDRIAFPVDARHFGPVPLQLFQPAAAHGLDDVGLDPGPDAVGVDHQPTLVGHDEAFADRPSAPSVHLDLGDRGHVSARVLVLYVGHAAARGHPARPRFWGRARLPTGALDRSLKHFDAARVVEVAQAELDGIGAGDG